LLGKDIIDALLAAARTEIEEEFVVHLSLQPLNDGSDDEDTLPSLRKPNLSCPPNMTIQHLCKFLMMQLIPRPELELEILVESKSEQLTVPKPPQRLSKLSKGKAWVSRAESGKEVVLLSSGHTLATVLSDFWDYRGNLELLYRRKS
jgi:E3 ubiquitin-protein ligase RNF1/2